MGRKNGTLAESTHMSVGERVVHAGARECVFVCVIGREMVRVSVRVCVCLCA